MSVVEEVMSVISGPTDNYCTSNSARPGIGAKLVERMCQKTSCSRARWGRVSIEDDSTAK